MNPSESLKQNHPEIYQLLQAILDEVKQATRPAEEVILDDVDLRVMLKVSKRTTATWRQKGLVKHSWLMGKCYYRLSDVLEAIEQNMVPSKKEKLKIKL